MALLTLSLVTVAKRVYIMPAALYVSLWPQAQIALVDMLKMEAWPYLMLQTVLMLNLVQRYQAPLSKIDEIREAAEADFEIFIRLVHPKRVLGSIHSELIQWMTRETAKSHMLILLPRDHQKSTVAGAYYAAWRITKNPAIRILYLSSASNLATKQLKFIKDILTSDIYKFYWPNMVNEKEGQREKWTETEFSVDHPKRKEENVRDPTVFTGGLTTTLTGLHCDLQVLDDVVVLENAYTEEGRAKVELQYSLLASILSADGQQIVVGTRYHPHDMYGKLIALKVQKYNAQGSLIGESDLYEVFERAIENIGDGSGQFLWPRQQRKDGQWFGFDREILENKRTQYFDQVQFRAQYYNDPNADDGSSIPKECFQYYDKSFLTNEIGTWRFKGKRLNIFACMDFAYTTKDRSDFTAIVVVGVDSERNFYVLDIDRFKTSQGDVFFDHIIRLHQKWGFNKIRAEVSGAQSVIVSTLKNEYIRPSGIALSVEEFTPPRYLGAKEERIQAVLQPRYRNRQVWHYLGGNCQTLEDELVLSNPSHDDIKDALASCIDSCVAPSRTLNKPMYSTETMQFNRFGGFS